MGGYGSGPYGWAGNKNPKATTSECPEIDIRRWKRDGLIVDRKSFNWSWYIDGKKTGAIGVLPANRDKLILLYGITGKSDDIKTVISLGYSPCNYGGERVWFHCPECFKRVAKLHLHRDRFCCRHCYNLAYKSSQDCGDVIDEAILKLRRVLRKLNCADWAPVDAMCATPARPKGMHGKTYSKLKREFYIAQQNYLRTFAAGCGIEIT